MDKKAALFGGKNNSFKIREYPVTPPGSGEVGLQLVSSGICGTDVHTHEGCLGAPDMPLILGHEFIGRVNALGPDAATDGLGNPLQVGDYAIACVALPCGKCFNCLRGETASCLNFGVTYEQNAENAPHFFGGFAEYLFSPAVNLVKLPDGVDPFAAAAFPCGGPTIIRAHEYGGGLEEGDLVVIQGNGSVGLFALVWAKAHNCRTIVIGSMSNPARTEFTQALEPDLFLDYRKTSPEEAVTIVQDFAAKLGRGDGADAVIETSGSPSAFPLGLKLLRTRGRYWVPGQYSERGMVEIPPHDITFRALQIIGSGQYTMADLGRYVDFLAKHPQLQGLFAKLLSKYPVQDVDRAMADAKAGKSIKAVLVGSADA